MGLHCCVFRFYDGSPAHDAAATLVGRAVFPVATFAQASGQQLGADPINGEKVPFINKQPVQSFSVIRDNGDGTFWMMADNGYGAIENSADFNLRVSKIRPHFKTKNGGSGRIDVEGFIELHDGNEVGRDPGVGFQCRYQGCRERPPLPAGCSLGEDHGRLGGP